MTMPEFQAEDLPYGFPLTRSLREQKTPANTRVHFFAAGDRGKGVRALRSQKVAQDHALERESVACQKAFGTRVATVAQIPSQIPARIAAFSLLDGVLKASPGIV